MQQATVSNYGECPCCHDTGWEVYKATVFEYGEPEELEFARPCQKCSGKRRAQDTTGIPEQYYESDISKFDFNAYAVDMTKLKSICMDFVRNWETWQKNGKGIYLYSKTPGSGKTYLASCLAKTVMIKHDLQMRFITAPDYLAMVGESYKRAQGTEDESAVYRSCRLLVLDDIGAQKEGDWQNQEIFRLLNERMEFGGITIFTSNSAPDQLKVGERTADRIIKSSVVLNMPEESIRRKKAEKEQSEFINRILSN